MCYRHWEKISHHSSVKYIHTYTNIYIFFYTIHLHIHLYIHTDVCIYKCISKNSPLKRNSRKHTKFRFQKLIIWWIWIWLFALKWRGGRGQKYHKGTIIIRGSSCIRSNSSRGSQPKESMPVREGVRRSGGWKGVSWSPTTLLVEGRGGGKGQRWSLLKTMCGELSIPVATALRGPTSAAARPLQRVAWRATHTHRRLLLALASPSSSSGCI